MPRYWNLDRVMRFVLTSLGVIVALCLVYYLRGVLFPFIAAFLIAYIVDPIVNKLQKLVKKRVIAVIIVLLAFARPACTSCVRTRRDSRPDRE